MRIPDSEENRAHFGGQTTRWDSTSGYPLVRLVTVMALRSHLLAGAAFGPYATAEGTYAEALWPLVPDHSVTLVDRGFLSARTLIGLERGGIQRHWLTRARSSHASTRIEHFAAGDDRAPFGTSAVASSRSSCSRLSSTRSAIRRRRSSRSKDALVALGWTSGIARGAVDEAWAHVGRDAPLEALIREALRRCPRPRS